MIVWSFEDGWHDDGPELQIPNPFEFTFYLGDNPISSDPWNKFVRPEIRTLPANQLPPEERDKFILDKEHCLKAFKGHGAWSGAFHTTVELERGIHIFNVNVYGDLVAEYKNGEKVPASDPLSGRLRLHVDDEITTWATLAPLRYMRYPVNIVVPEKKDVNISVEFMLPHALQNNGIFADYWTIEKIYDLDDCPEGWGLPRVQYARTYVLLHTSLNKTWACAAINGGWQRRWTVGASADDAGMGQLLNKVVVIINPNMWQNSIIEFFKKYYPKVTIKTITASTPTELAKKLQNEDYDGENGYNGPIYPKTTKKHVGLHVQIMQDKVFEFVQNNPSIMKFFSQTDCGTAKLLNPDTTIIFRHFIENQNADSDPHDYIDRFSSGLWEQVNKIRTQNPNIKTPYFYAESFNEMYPSLNRPVVEQVANYDVRFAEVIHAEFGEYVAPALFCAAIGNPHPTEYDLLVRVAKAAVKYKGLLGYHDYWWGARNESGLLIDWSYHSGRWQEIDKYFTQFDIYPRWYGGETGVVYGMPFNAGAGWLHSDVYNGNWELLFNDIKIKDNLVAEWNAENGNRFIGSVLFTTGAKFTGWEWFQIQPPEIQKLIQFLKN